MAKRLTMIAQINEFKKETFNTNDVLKCFFVLLNTVGGKMTVQKKTLDFSVPKDFMEKIQIEHIENIDAYTISIKRPETKGIVTPSKRVIIPK